MKVVASATGCLGGIALLFAVWAGAIAWGTSIFMADAWTAGDIFWKAVACIALLVGARILSLVPQILIMLSVAVTAKD